jgi:hypothetical protein
MEERRFRVDDEVLKSVPPVAKVLVEPEGLRFERDELSNRS